MSALPATFFTARLDPESKQATSHGGRMTVVGRSGGSTQPMTHWCHSRAPPCLLVLKHVSGWSFSSSLHMPPKPSQLLCGRFEP